MALSERRRRECLPCTCTRATGTVMLLDKKAEGRSNSQTGGLRIAGLHQPLNPNEGARGSPVVSHRTRAGQARSLGGPLLFRTPLLLPI